MTWIPVDTGHRDAAGQEDDDTQQGAGRPWLWPLLALVVVVALAGAGIYILLRMAEKPPVILEADNSTAAQQDALIIPDTVAPVISNIAHKDLSYNSVEIVWTTDEPSTSQVIWRAGDGPMSSTAKKNALVSRHVVELTGLKNKQMYYFKVLSADQSGNEAVSVEDSFDIGLLQGVTAVSVKGGSENGGSIKTEEPQPGVFRTVISGRVVNTGEVPVRTRDIEVWIKTTVSGKPGTSDVQAQLDPVPAILSPLSEIGFRAVVPDRTDPKFTVTCRINDLQQ